MERPLRAAVIGLGSMGANHLRVYSEIAGVEVVGVADTDPERVARATAGRTFPGFPDAATLLVETSPDIVSVVVPTTFHEEVALQALAAGCQVLVEKPIAATLEAARRVAAASAARGRMLSVGHIVRFNSAVRELKQRLTEGQGGPVLEVQTRRVGPFPHRIRDVGVIHDLATHDIDIMRYLLGDDVATVYAVAQSHINTAYEDLVSAMLLFRGGVIGTLDVNWLTPTKERTLTVLCERGMFVVDHEAQSLEFYENFAARAREGAIASVTEGPMTRYPIAYQEPLRLELEQFRDAVLSGGVPPVSAHDGIAAIAVAEAMVRSAKQGMPVPVDEVGAQP